MTIYLTIMVTVLVATQIIRITQNHISLFRQRKEFEKHCKWVEDVDLSEKDFEVQREVYRMLYEKLKKDDVMRVCPVCGLEVHQILNRCPKCGNDVWEDNK